MEARASAVDGSMPSRMVPLMAARFERPRETAEMLDLALREAEAAGVAGGVRGGDT
jgi:hypothetical protein